MSHKIIRKGDFDLSQIRKFDTQLTPQKVTPTEPQHTKPHVFEENEYHAKKITIFKDAECEAKEIVENARNEAIKESERIKKEAYAKGYKDGETKALNEGRTYVADAVKSVTALIKEVTNYKNNLIKEAEGQLLKLSVEIAGKIILKELDKDDEIVVAIVKKAIKNLIDRETLTIRLNPKDIEIIKKEKVNIMHEVDGIKNLTIIEDESIIRGGCYIETTSSEVDARIDKQLNIISKTLERK